MSAVSGLQAKSSETVFPPKKSRFQIVDKISEIRQECLAAWYCTRISKGHTYKTVEGYELHKLINGLKGPNSKLRPGMQSEKFPIFSSSLTITPELTIKGYEVEDYDDLKEMEGIIGMIEEAGNN